MTTRKQTMNCEEARARISQHVQGGLPSEEATPLRAHFDACRECETLYRGQVEASVNVGLTAIEEVEQAELRRRVARAQTLEGMGERSRGFRWRILFLPMFFAWLIIQVSGVFSQAPRIVLVDASGTVDVAGRPIEAYEELGADDVLLLVRGAWCQVAAGGRAVFEVPKGRVSLSGPAAVLAERVDPPRLRVQYGTVEVEMDGPLELITQRGSVEIASGRGVVIAGPEMVEVSWVEGEGLLINAWGETALEAGTVLRR